MFLRFAVSNVGEAAPSAVHRRMLLVNVSEERAIFVPCSPHSGLRRLQGLTEHVIAVIMRDVASALAYLHKDGIIHRDLKVSPVSAGDSAGTLS